MFRTRWLPALCTATLLLAAPAAPAGAAGSGPLLSGLSPQAVAPGATLTLSGSGFGVAGPGAEVLLFGPAVSAPAVAAKVLLWQPNLIRVQVPAAQVWPGISDVRVVNPAAGPAPSAALPLTVTPAGAAVVGAAAAWVPTGAGGTLHVGWNDADGAPLSPILLTLPTASPGGAAAFSVPGSIPAADVTVNGVAAASVSVGAGSLAWPGGGTAAAATLRITPAPGSTSLPGEVVIDLEPGAGISAPAAAGPLPLQAGPSGAEAALQVQIDPNAVAGYRITVPAAVPAGSPFTVAVQAIDSAGAPVSGQDGPLYLASGGDVNFTGAAAAADGPTTAAVPLAVGTAQVTAVAQVPGPVTIRVTDAAGLTGSAALSIGAPAAGSGLSLQVFPPYSGFTGSPQTLSVASLDSLDRRSGAMAQTGGTSGVFGGFWPSGIGNGYEAAWTGTLTVAAPTALPAPLSEPTLTFAFLNVAAQSGSASLTPLAGTGASIDGAMAGVALNTASTATGWAAPTTLQLAPGRYTLSVQASEDAPSADAGDTLYYSEAFTGATGTVWSPLTPVPPAAFTPAGIPDPAVAIPVGAGSADLAGAPYALPTPAVIENGRTLLPLRALAQALGSSVSWNAATQGITVSGPGGSPPVTQLTVGSASATVNGNPVTLDQPALLLPPGVTMVPLRFLAQTLGWQVGWDPASRTALLLPPLLPAEPLQP